MSCRALSPLPAGHWQLIPLADKSAFITLRNHVYFISKLYGHENHLLDGVETPNL